MAVYTYSFLQEGFIKNQKAKAEKKKEDKAANKALEATAKSVLPKVKAATKKVIDRYNKDPKTQKRISSLLKSYLKKTKEEGGFGSKDEEEDVQYYVDHPDEVELFSDDISVHGGTIGINTNELNPWAVEAINPLMRSIAADIKKELGDIGVPYTIRGPKDHEEEYGGIFITIKGSQNESAIDEGLNLFGRNKKDNKSQTRMQQQPAPLSTEQKADAKKIIAQIKKISPSVIANANKNRNYVGWLNNAADLVDYDEYTKGKKLTRKWDCWFGDTSDDEIVVYCMDKSIIDADNACLDSGEGDYHFSKYTHNIIGNLADEIVDKLTDKYGLDVLADPDSIDGAIWFMIRNRE